MIQNLTEPYIILRNEIVKKQNEYKKQILQMLQIRGNTVCCLLCSRALAQNTYLRSNLFFIRSPPGDNNGNTRTFKLFECCINKSEIIKIIAKGNSEENGAEPSQSSTEGNICNSCFTNLHRYPRPVFSMDNTEEHEELPLREALEYYGEQESLQRIFENISRRRMTSMARELDKRHVRYKIDIIIEEMKANYENYTKAIEMQQETDAECFRIIYNELHEEKNRLMKKIDKSP
ncbi:hypothetical protein PAEPH01_1317 [Pancytospora epiphaga]|nr:hypothetical protein PAEPH01_1317 [Pancytospora epiphaga]